MVSMNTEEPGYSTYSLFDLYDVHRRIDRDAYPDRARRIDEEIARRTANLPWQSGEPASLRSPFERVRIRSLVLMWIVLGLLFTIAALAAGSDLSRGGFWEIASAIVIYPAEVIWLLHTARVAGISLSRLVGVWPGGAGAWRWTGLLIPLWLLSVGVVWLYYLILRSLSRIPDLSEDLPADRFQYWILSLPVVVLIGPILEELIFRGMILNRWAAKWSLRRSIIFSSLFFGFLHADFIGGAVFGVVMSLLYLRTGTLLVPIVLHVGYNAIAMGLEGHAILAPSKVVNPVYERFPWMGAICLVIAVIALAHFVRRSWPAAGDGTPY